MANLNGASSARSMLTNGRPSALPPKIPSPYISSSYSDYIPGSAAAPMTQPKHRDGGSHHHRTSSENLLLDEKPFWLDDLLDEPESPLRKAGHRRSSSDSFTYFDLDNNRRRNTESQDDRYSLLNLNSYAKTKNWDSPRGLTSPMEKSFFQHGGVWNSSKNTDKSLPRSNETKDSIESGYGDIKQPIDKNATSYLNNSEAETKRNKQQYAQRSRVRKLQYIAELERNVQALQAEGCEASAELEFINQKILILSMENKALKQRLESLAREQLIKYMEHEMLEREVGRLRNLYQRQKHQTSTNRDINDIDQHFSMLSVQPKESGAARD